jgi:hypothetical protein
VLLLKLLPLLLFTGVVVSVAAIAFAVVIPLYQPTEPGTKELGRATKWGFDVS